MTVIIKIWHRRMDLSLRTLRSWGIDRIHGPEVCSSPLSLTFQVGFQGLRSPFHSGTLRSLQVYSLNALCSFSQGESPPRLHSSRFLQIVRCRPLSPHLCLVILRFSHPCQWQILSLSAKLWRLQISADKESCLWSQQRMDERLSQAASPRQFDGVDLLVVCRRQNGCEIVRKTTQVFRLLSS